MFISINILHNSINKLYALLAPTLTVNLNPSLFTGNSGEDALELLCTAVVAEDVMSASYQFTWIKNNAPVDISNDRIVV